MSTIRKFPKIGYTGTEGRTVFIFFKRSYTPTLCTTPKMQPVGLKLFKATHSTVWAFTEPWHVPRTVLGVTLHEH